MAVLLVMRCELPSCLLPLSRQKGGRVHPITPDANATWLLTELDPESDLLFGFCDLGSGFPELGHVSLGELEALRGPLGLRVERDLYFAPTRTLAAYAELAREHRRVMT